MKILDDLLSDLKGNNFSVESVYTCVFWTAVITKHGTDAICGSKVIDVEKVTRSISEGATFKEITGVRLLTMAKR